MANIPILSLRRPRQRSFGNSRLWSDVDRRQLRRVIGVIAEGTVQGFGKVTGDFGPGRLVTFDRFAPAEPSISNGFI